MELELCYFGVTAQHFSYYTMGTLHNNEELKYRYFWYNSSVFRLHPQSWTIVHKHETAKKILNSKSLLVTFNNNNNIYIYIYILYIC